MARWSNASVLFAWQKPRLTGKAALRRGYSLAWNSSPRPGARPGARRARNMCAWKRSNLSRATCGRGGGSGPRCGPLDKSGKRMLPGTSWRTAGSRRSELPLAIASNSAAAAPFRRVARRKRRALGCVVSWQRQPGPRGAPVSARVRGGQALWRGRAGDGPAPAAPSTSGTAHVSAVRALATADAPRREALAASASQSASAARSGNGCVAARSAASCRPLSDTGPVLSSARPERPAQGQGAHARLVLQARSGHDVQHLPCRPAAPAAGVLSCAARRRLPVPGQRGLLAANDRRGAQLPPRLPECAAPRLQRRARLRGRRGARARHHEQDHPAQAHAHGSRPRRPRRHVHTHQSHVFFTRGPALRLPSHASRGQLS